MQIFSQITYLLVKLPRQRKKVADNPKYYMNNCILATFTKLIMSELIYLLMDCETSY